MLMTQQSCQYLLILTELQLQLVKLDGSSLRAAADHLVDRSRQSMIADERKTKEMLIYFGTTVDTSNVSKIIINSTFTERVDHLKL